MNMITNIAEVHAICLTYTILMAYSSLVSCFREQEVSGVTFVLLSAGRAAREGSL